MVAKLMAIVLTLALTAAGLLAIRQQRLQAVSEMAAAIERASALERQTWKVRASIAGRVSPSTLKALIVPLGEVESLVTPWREVIPVVTDRESPDAGGDVSG
jgi:hypothetical protein